MVKIIRLNCEFNRYQILAVPSYMNEFSTLELIVRSVIVKSI